MMRSEPKYITTQELCSILGISKGSLYSIPSMPARDAVLRDKIVEVIAANPTYGHKRIALDLNRNQSDTGPKNQTTATARKRVNSRI